MTLNADVWQVRAALCELLALSFRYPDIMLAEAVASGEWDEAAEEIAGAAGMAWPVEGAPGAAEAAEFDDVQALLSTLRAEATRLFIGAPEPVVSPYEGVWRAADEGVQALLFVNPHSMEVERFCMACGLGRPEGTNEPLDHIATELELLEYLAARAAVDANGTPGAVEKLPEGAIASVDLPGGSASAAWQRFMDEHVQVWIPRFAEEVVKKSASPFYRQSALLLSAALVALS